MKQKRAILAVLVSAPIGVIWAQGCGPSVQSVYEGNVRFEHCYRLDIDPNIAASHRQACWLSYVERYHYGQTKDRIEYARRRTRALAAGDTSRPVLKLETADDAAAPVSPAEAPMPTSVHAPPPPTAKPPAPDGGPSDAGNGADSAPPPEAKCSAECWSDWRTCGGVTCAPDAGGKVGQACQRCDRDYRRCMQRCFR